MEASSKVLLTYGDSTLRGEDVALFSDGKWLNDNCISFYFEHLTKECTDNSEEVLLIDPCLSALVAFEDQFEELEDYCQPLKIGKRSYVFIPVNDKSDKFLPVGGSHWALLVLEVKTQEFYYYDSTGGVISMANELARKFLSVLRAEPIETNSEAKFNRVKDSSRQKNGYDCGMYLLLNTQNLLQSLNNGEKLDSTKPLVPTIIPTQVTKARSDIKKLISDLINQKASSNKV